MNEKDCGLPQSFFMIPVLLSSFRHRVVERLSLDEGGGIDA